jgi:putative aldouronate transport system permease protein
VGRADGVSGFQAAPRFLAKRLGIFLMLNALNREVGEVYDTYVYTAGLQRGQFSYTTAVNLFKNGVGLVLVVFANYAAKKFGEEGVY